ncbi:1,2-phenylacetyl-CoA epoxidase subunit PaaD [Allosphingosinicella indica]|uniref:1,2-phenylacetyl-CoA epoxidase subunit PaaD n=1 Tax=Allosphingosinicella indica TaxID=941907 RepID=UPI003CC7F23F
MTWGGAQERGRASSGDATPTQPSPIEGEGSIWQVLEAVPDPEIPVLGITDLGIVRHADADRVVLTPTYTGCPATHVIETMVREALDAAGYRATRIETVLTPPWTTDWITGEGRAKLKAYGIAPPLPAGVRAVECPQCGSSDTAEISRFGSTPCKSLWRCHACLEPFDHFKCH